MDAAEHHSPAGEDGLRPVGGSVARSAARHPRVSVVIPCYNYAEYLDAALRSVLSQQGVDLDVTIVDDGSTDGSLEISRDWVVRDSRVALKVHDENRGHIDTFNDALASAKAPYVVKLDPDDLLTPGSLRRSADVLERHPDVSFVYGRSLYFRGAAPQVPGVGTRSVRVWAGERWVWRRAAGGVNVIRQPEVMIRTSMLALSGGHRSEVPEASDYHLWLRLASTGQVARIRGPVQGLYRLHAASMQHTIHSGILSDLRARTRAFDLFLDECADTLRDPEGVRQRAHRTLSREAILRALDAFDAGTAATEPIDGLVELALQLDEGVMRTSRWRQLQRHISRGRDSRTPWWSMARLLRKLRWNHRVAWMTRYRT